MLSRWFILASALVLIACLCIPGSIGKNPAAENPIRPTAAATFESPTARPSQTEKPRSSPIPPPAPTLKAATQAPTQNTSGMKTWQEAGLYQVQYPSGWSITQTGGWRDFCTDAEQIICFHVQPQKGFTNLNQFMNDAYVGFKSAVGDYRLIGRKDVSLNGVPAVLIEQSYTFHGLYKQGFAAYLVNKNMGFALQAEIVGQLPPEEYDKNYQLLKQMIYTFEVKN